MITINEAKIQTIKEKIPNLTDLSFVLSETFAANVENHRENIRAVLAKDFSFRFNRQQLAQLSDLNVIPTAAQGFFSISHCPALGGFSYANFKHGFDMESVDRISKPIIQRTCAEDEITGAPNAKFLWVAKEAAIKALSVKKNDFLISDFQTENWKSHFETEFFSYRITSKKTLDLSLNKGFVFSEKDILFGLFFK